jgi:hypothetical protein
LSPACRPITSASPSCRAISFSHPTLIWTLENNGGTRHRVEASYLARSLSWIADYVLTVGRDDKTGDIDGWVTVTNGSGTSFRNAQLQLVAGDLNRVRQELKSLADNAAQEAVAVRGADVPGIVLRIPPLHARAENDDQQR